MGLRPLFDDMARRLASNGLAVCAVEPYAHVDREHWATVEARLAAAPATRRRGAARRPRSRRRSARRRGRRRAGIGARLLHGRLLHLQGGRVGSLRRGGRVLRHVAHARSAGAVPAMAATRSTSPRRCARRSRSSAARIGGRHRPTSRRCVPRGAIATTARSSSSKVRTTVSCTIPTARCTAPKMPPRSGRARSPGCCR